MFHARIRILSVIDLFYCFNKYTFSRNVTRGKNSIYEIRMNLCHPQAIRILVVLSPRFRITMEIRSQIIISAKLTATFILTIDRDPCIKSLSFAAGTREPYIHHKGQAYLLSQTQAVVLPTYCDLL